MEILRQCPNATEIQFGDDGQWKALCDNDEKCKNAQIDIVAGKSLVKIVKLVDNCMQFMVLISAGNCGYVSKLSADKENYGYT